MIANPFRQAAISSAVFAALVSATGSAAAARPATPADCQDVVPWRFTAAYPAESCITYRGRVWSNDRHAYPGQFPGFPYSVYPGDKRGPSAQLWFELGEYVAPKANPDIEVAVAAGQDAQPRVHVVIPSARTSVHFLAVRPGQPRNDARPAVEGQVTFLDVMAEQASQPGRLVPVRLRAQRNTTGTGYDGARVQMDGSGGPAGPGTLVVWYEPADNQGLRPGQRYRTPATQRLRLEAIGTDLADRPVLQALTLGVDIVHRSARSESIGFDKDKRRVVLPLAPVGNRTAWYATTYANMSGAEQGTSACPAGGFDKLAVKAFDDRGDDTMLTLRAYRAAQEDATGERVAASCRLPGPGANGIGFLVLELLDEDNQSLRDPAAAMRLRTARPHQIALRNAEGELADQAHRVFSLDVDLQIEGGKKAPDPVDPDDPVTPEDPETPAGSEPAAEPRRAHLAPGTRQIGGTYTRDSGYARNFKISDLRRTGMAGNLSYLNYGYADIQAGADGHYRCAAGETDAFADYGKTFIGVDSVDRVSDNSSRSPLRGNFNQLRKLKQGYRMKTLISIGGEGKHAAFALAASTAAGRKALAESCVDRYIAGNLPAIPRSAGGNGVAKGVFNGINLEWLAPRAADVREGTAQSIEWSDYLELVKAFRDAIDTAGGDHLLTASMNPAEDFPGRKTAIAIASELNWINVHAYDFAIGADATTGHASAIRVPNGATPGNAADMRHRSLTGVMQRVGDAGVPEVKQVYGIPMHGHGWTDVQRGRQNGLRMDGRSAASRFGSDVKDYRDIKRLRGYRSYVDTTSMGAFRYDGWTFWSWDSRAVVQRKVDLIQEPGKLGGVFASDFSGDDNGELLRVMSTRYRR